MVEAAKASRPLLPDKKEWKKNMKNKLEIHTGEMLGEHQAECSAQVVGAAVDHRKVVALLSIL